MYKRIDPRLKNERRNDARFPAACSNSPVNPRLKERTTARPKTVAKPRLSQTTAVALGQISSRTGRYPPSITQRSQAAASAARRRKSAAGFGRQFGPQKKSSSSKRGLSRIVASRFEKVVFPEQLIPTTTTRARSSLAGGFCIKASRGIASRDSSKQHRSNGTRFTRPSRARRAFCKN